MELMINFTTVLLQQVAAFLGSEPVIYLFAICCLCGIVKVFRQLMP